MLQLIVAIAAGFGQYPGTAGRHQYRHYQRNRFLCGLFLCGASNTARKGSGRYYGIRKRSAGHVGIAAEVSIRVLPTKLGFLKPKEFMFLLLKKAVVPIKVASKGISSKIDGFKMAKFFSDLSGYLGSKRPDDIVNVTILRGGDEKVIPVTLVKLEVYQIDELGLEVKNINTSELKSRGVKHGVKVSRALTPTCSVTTWKGLSLPKSTMNLSKLSTTSKNAMNHREYNEPIKLTFVNQQGETHSFIFR